MGSGGVWEGYGRGMGGVWEGYGIGTGGVWEVEGKRARRRNSKRVGSGPKMQNTDFCLFFKCLEYFQKQESKILFDFHLLLSK